MIRKAFCLKKFKCIPCLIFCLVVSGAWLFLKLRMIYLPEVEIFTDKCKTDGRYIIIYNKLRHDGCQTNKTKLLHGDYSANNSTPMPSIPVYPLFQSAKEEEFPATDGPLPRIPHIIHQIFSDKMIPEMYIKHMRSFIKHNPTWDYRFWTYQSGRRLLLKRHPYLVKVYNKFGNSVKRSDLLRYEYCMNLADFMQI
ncbi:uncharacterized protein LOC128555577 isoform X2 [Mercenaria mercenaria]|uniref:uncharacterized protein LOC128555577 isoform X2 n=1 Tax=Mercenaria mercenaria TaxID=6596 RepID=UPI00234F087C|nr:uncharacterized protein LOC128555577 isoform X2 [Mercenaria mercenaria]